MSILSNGNVGIGDTTPSTKLVVNGVITLVVVNTPGETLFIESPIDDNLIKRVYEVFAN